MSDPQAACDRVLRRHFAGALSAPCAVMELILLLEDVAEATRVVQRAAAHTRSVSEAECLDELAELLRRHAAGCEKIEAMLQSGLDSSEPAANVDEGIRSARRLFDWSVQQSEEASVALYSLGSPELLASATYEVVSLLDDWKLIDRARVALEIGCGIGRFITALAPRLSHITGLDVSPNMIEAASRRCEPFANVRLAVCSGRDLSGIDDASVDLVLAIDSFPYVVQAGQALVDAYFGEVARVLRAGGDFVVLNFSYRGSDAQDCADVARACAAHGLTLVVAGERPFTMWNGLAFHIRARR